MKKLGFWAAILGTLAAMSAIGLIVLIISFVQDTSTNERQILASGDIVYATESRRHNTFIEDTSPTTLLSHDFILTNTATGHVIHSRPSAAFSTNYTISNVHGSTIVVVDLDAGSYVIEFAPLESNGRFVWDHNMYSFWLSGCYFTCVFGFVMVSL